MKNDNNSSDGVIELWGQEFKRAKEGLDENQIVSYVNELINERDTLLKRQEHLSSLSMLAERTIAEADDLARQLKDEATEKASAEARDIVAQAEEQARQMIEDKKAEALAQANEEAEAIKADAQREADLLKEEQVKRAQSELRNMAQQLYQEILSQLDSFKQQVTATKANFEQTLSQPEQANPATVEEESRTIPSNDLETTYEASESTLAEASEETQTVAQPDDNVVEEEIQVSTISHEMPEYEGEVELEILPPIEMRKIMGIISYLDTLAEVRSTELIPLADRPLVKVSLRESMHLLQTLRSLPEVGQATEAVEEDEQRKIQITLNEQSILDVGKQKLNDDIIKILSR